MGIQSVGANVIAGAAPEPVELVVEAVRTTLHPEKFWLVSRMAALANYIGNTSRHMLANARNTHISGSLQLFSLGCVPIVIAGIASGLFSSLKTTVNEKIDIGLDIAASIGSLGEIAADTADGLAAVGAVASGALWTTPLAIASAVIQGLGMILTTKNLVETHRFSVLFHKESGLSKSLREYSLEDYTKIRQLIVERHEQEKSFVGKHFDTDGGKLVERLLAIETAAKAALSSGISKEVLRGKHMLKATMQKLANKMTDKKWSHSVSLLAGTVSYIGFGVLFSPLAPIGYGMLATSGVISLTNFFMDKFNGWRFEKLLGIE